MNEEVTYSNGQSRDVSFLFPERNFAMPGTLTRFRIEALHNRHTIDIPITDNKLILIGENGTGKSTVTNFIYFFLTRQWHRMLTYNFKRVVATIDDKDIEVTKEDCKVDDESDYLRETRIRQRIADLLEMARETADEDLLRQYTDLSAQLQAISFHKSSHKIKDINQILEDSFPNRVLYLPTYRRIEQDLSAIFPELASSAAFRRSIEKLKSRSQSAGYVELVQFGMQDVEETIERTMKNLSDHWRDDLSKLTGTYLRDVIQGSYKSAQLAEIGELDDSAIDTIFNRIDQTVLPQPEQNRLREMVAKIRADRYILDNDDRVVVHFLTRLIKLHKDQQAKEKNIREFVIVCNQYLSGKEFIYDNLNFKIFIRQLDTIAQSDQEEKPGILKMSMLSSGEKQIVSLFSQIYLSESSNYFVIIDEPELSLSVFWQKRFLPDILKSERCTGLIAVTHSPFICDNELDQYMHSIELFMEPVDAAR
jgi:predicted ATPase